MRYFVRFTLSFAVIVCSGLWLLANYQQIAWAIGVTDINITEQNRTLIVVVQNPQNSTLTWHYSQSIAIDECNEDSAQELILINDDLTRENRLVLAINSTDPYCFQITDEETGLSAWKAYQPSEIITTTIDRQSPTITVNRTNNNLLTISAADSDLSTNSWRYARFRQNPDCTAVQIENSLPTGRSNNLILRESDNNQWYCFKALDQTGNPAFSKYRVQGVDTTGPVIVIKQNGRLLTATSEDGTARDWIYFSSPSDINCDVESFLNNYSVTHSNQVTLTAGRINYNYCFRARDTVGNLGFKKYKITNVDFLAPAINIKQDGLSIVADADAPIETWHYLKFDNNIQCDEQSDFKTAVNFSETQQIVLNEDDHRFYFCVRGISSINVTSFAKIRVDTQKPKVELLLDESSIAASADKEIASWEYLKTQKELDCDQAAAEQFTESSFDKHQGQKSQLSQLDNGLWFCFKATDEFGNSGYAKQQIHGITRLAPGGTVVGTRGRAESIAIVIIAVLAGTGFLVHTLLQKKRQAAASARQTTVDDEIIQPAKNRRKHKKRAKDRADAHDVVQPLDYLKKDKDN